MPRISQLPSLTAADNSDELAIVDVSASTTKKITRGDLLKSPLPTNSVTTAAVTNGSITAPKLDWTTINLGYSSGATAQTISTTDTNITGVSTTITSTGLRVRLEAVLNFVISSNAWGIVSIYEGSTLIKQASAYSNGANATATVVAYITPTSGSHTYTLRARTNSGSMTTHSDLAGREAFLAVSVA